MRIAITVMLSTMVFFTGFGQVTSTFRDRDKAEKNTNKFDPTYWKQDEKKHFAFSLKYMQDSSFQITAVEVRVGNMPHKSKTGGEVRITYKDSINNTLGSYYTSDPLIVRSCDEGMSHLQTLLVGAVIEVRTPYLLNIHSIEIEHVYKKTTNKYLVDPYVNKWRLTDQ